MARKKRNKSPSGAAPGSRRVAWNNRALSSLRALKPSHAHAAEPKAEVRAQPSPSPRFRDLVEGVAPLPDSQLRRVPLPPARAQGAGRRLANPPRLWVEESHGHLQARAADAPPQVLVDLQRGKIPPRAQIDLHGHDAVQARQALNRSVSQCRAAGCGCLLVVYGRGLHSDAGGPVLPDIVAQHLSEVLAEGVVAFCTAPRRWGGLGALLVCLRTGPRTEISLDP